MSNTTNGGNIDFPNFQPITVQHPRCECHDCTQARMAEYQSMVRRIDWEAGERIIADRKAAALAERERCAKIADHPCEPYVPVEITSGNAKSWSEGFTAACALIADRIRCGG